ncbi:MAG: IPT/TIG domain-containing protein [Pseudomonadota bacterium]
MRYVLAGIVFVLGVACGGDDFLGPRNVMVVPSEARVGEMVDLVGSGFDGENRFVTFGGKSANVAFWESGRVRVIVPGGVFGETLIVVTVDGRRSGAVPFTVLNEGVGGSP